MKAEDFHRIVDAGESDRLEFKAKAGTVPSIAKSLCAFLNSEGGQLIIGVGTDGKLLGVKNATSLCDKLKRELPALFSPLALWHVEVYNIEEKDFVVVEVAAGFDKPYVCAGSIFVRTGESNQTASRDEISKLISDRSIAGERWERQIVMGANLSDIDLDLVVDTAEIASESQRWSGDTTDPEAFLSDHGLLASGRLTNGAVVMFGKTPTRFFPQARVRLLELPDGKTGSEFEFDQLFDSNILKMVEEIEPILSARIGGVSSQFVDDSWERKDQILYPPMAIREAVLNAIIHRDYQMNGSILISILPDQLKITNPGELPDGLKLADLKREHPSIPVNPDIAHICYLRRLIDKVGRGTQKIVESCREQKLKIPKWSTASSHITLTLFAPVKKSRTNSTLSARQTQILKIVTEQGPISAPRIVEQINDNVSARTIRSDIKLLVEAGALMIQGQARSAVYTAASDPPKNSK